MTLQETAKISAKSVPALRLGPVEAQDLPILHRLLEKLTGRADWPIDARSPEPQLTFGGPELDAYPPLPLFAAPEEAPTRRLRRILLVSDAPLPVFLGLVPVDAVVSRATDLPFDALDADIAPADLVVTSDRRVAAYANGWLKPAILIAEEATIAPWPCLPFTLVGVRKHVFGLARRFDHAESMPDMLNWKRQTVDRLGALLGRLVSGAAA